MTSAKLTPEQEAFEAFGDAWARLRQIEGAIVGGDGPSFVHNGAIQEVQQKAQALRDIIVSDGADSLSDIMDACQGRNYRFTCEDRWDGKWHAEFEYDHVSFEGRGSSLEAALVEALVDKQIGDYYYAMPMDCPSLSQEDMTARLRDAYRDYLGEDANHEYRGSYLRGVVNVQK